MSTVLITGCSSGIGRALADAFRDAGHQVWATARQAEDVARLAAAGFVARQLDVNDPHALALLAQELDALDILINNAGYGAMGPVLDGGVDALQRQFQTNVFALVGVTRALFPPLRRAKGLVVNIGSVSGVLVTPFAGAYCASKAAVKALSGCPAPGAGADGHTRDGSAAWSDCLAVRQSRPAAGAAGAGAGIAVVAIA